MKIEGLIADVASVGSSARAKRDIIWVFLDVFWSIQATFFTYGHSTGLVLWL